MVEKLISRSWLVTHFDICGIHAQKLLIEISKVWRMPSQSNQCFCLIADEMGLLTNNVLKLFHVLTGWATFQVLTSNSQLKGKSWPFGLTDHPLCTYCFRRNATPLLFSTTQFLLKIRASAQTKGCENSSIPTSSTCFMMCVVSKIFPIIIGSC